MNPIMVFVLVTLLIIVGFAGAVAHTNLVRNHGIIPPTWLSGLFFVVMFGSLIVWAVTFRTWATAALDLALYFIR